MSRIYIIGYGAIGKVLAVALQRNNRKVSIIRGSVSGQPLRKERIIVESPSQQWEAEIETGSPEYFPSLDDGLVILSNKSYGNESLSESLRAKITTAPVVLLQNGLNVERPFLEKGYESVYRCVLFATSQDTGKGSVKFKPVAPSAIGVIKGEEKMLIEIVQQLNTEIFPFRSEKGIWPVIWKKAIINCVFNSVCPLLETDNGIFHRDEQVFLIARRVVEECVEIAAAEGISLHADEVTENLLQISRSSDGQLISTYQDILHKRETEITTLNGEIAEIARRLHKQHIVRETRLLGELTLLKSKLHR
ncbi:MAG: ketopantoate reductase family protein [Pseudobacter sp.]|uniref:ketopantoate reductase family protein n=1 Tax=Pseudobacter sp. TaxID=2045420 RepID=UPI003F7E8FB4